MACDKDAVALLTFSPPQAKAWLYDLVDANPATGIMLCRRHANATVVPMAWQLVDSRDPAWTPPGEPVAAQPQPAAIPGLLAEETTLTEPLIEPFVDDRPAAPEPAMATILSTTVHRDYPSQPPAMPQTLTAQPQPQVIAQHQPVQPAPQPLPEYPAAENSPPAAQLVTTGAATHVTYATEPAAVTPTVTAPSPAAAMPASPMVGTAAAAVVAPPLPDPHLDPPVARIPRRTETISVDANVVHGTSHVVSLNEQIAAHAGHVAAVQPVQKWVEPPAEAGPPAAADLVANIQERLLPDPSLFELPLDAPAVTPHHGYR